MADEALTQMDAPASLVNQPNTRMHFTKPKPVYTRPTQSNEKPISAAKDFLADRVPTRSQARGRRTEETSPTNPRSQSPSYQLLIDQLHSDEPQIRTDEQIPVDHDLDDQNKDWEDIDSGPEFPRALPDDQISDAEDAHSEPESPQALPDIPNGLQRRA
ncbi:hypothetical protein H2200_010986 [Cladophialophora chaetospira]|uniref:Uncharacterized protein n=1 Tax=Cladophialophora chaetospira TaxID=386627 RepID=A0AA38X153_9EURO|nr:hypothetical protein H2200_010986 [Cladophialophora chaetospira]